MKTMLKKWHKYWHGYHMRKGWFYFKKQLTCYTNCNLLAIKEAQEKSDYHSKKAKKHEQKYLKSIDQVKTSK